MKFFLTTDTHFGHDKMMEYCGRPRGHEWLILKGLENVLTNEDILIHLGDFCIGKDSYWHEQFMYRLPCRKWLVRGNHDKKSNSWYLEHGWNFVGEGIRGVYYGKKLLFTHIPTPDDGWYELNIHGHMHNNLHRFDEVPHNPKQLLLSVEDNKYQPWELQKII